MSHRSPRAQRGFTLMELMVVTAIVAILAAIAYPTYTTYTQRARRSDAMNTMTSMAQQLERCYSQSFSYAGCAQVPAGTSKSTNNYYSIVLTVAAAGNSWSMTATPNGPPQNADTTCASFTLTSGGGQSATNSGGTSTTSTCWQSS